MILIKKIADLQNLLQSCRAGGHTVGFVPTMGALHQGHLALVESSKAACEKTVCSIFVNPTQFTNRLDFEKYPISIERDIDLLEEAGCDVLFLPVVQEMYPANEAVERYELGYLEDILEGKYRPGHFQGVCQIVDKLLSVTKPHCLFIGQKDYQQCMVIQKMISLKKLPVALQICETLREPNGLAMSSRNLRLSEEEKSKAAVLIQTLRTIKRDLKRGNVQNLLQEAHNSLTSAGFEVDYVAIASAQNLLPVTDWDGEVKCVALVAATLNSVRLIDNILLN